MVESNFMDTFLAYVAQEETFEDDFWKNKLLVETEKHKKEIEKLQKMIDNSQNEAKLAEEGFQSHAC